MSPRDKNPLVTRRNVLLAAAAGGLVGAASILGGKGANTNDQTAPSDYDQPAGQPTETKEETTHGEPEHGFIEFVPKNASGDEDWLANPIFSDDKFSGEITYELNIDEALEHRSIVKDQAEEFPEVDEFVEHFWPKNHEKNTTAETKTEDEAYGQEWRQNFREKYEEAAKIEAAKIDVSVLKSDKPPHIKVTESNLHDFILDYQDFHNGWDISSTYRDALAAMIQGVLDPDRVEVIISPHEVVDLSGGYHGMAWGIGRPAGHRANYPTEEAYRKAKQEEISVMFDTPYPQSEKHDERAEEVSESDYTEEGTWEWEHFAHFALYNGEDVNRGDGATEEQMRKRVQQAFLNFTMNQNHERSFDVKMDKEFALELARYARNPAASELTGSFIKEYSAAIRDMDESGMFEDYTVELGIDYVKV